MSPAELFCVKANQAKSARNIGVIFDKNFTFHSLTSAICSSCFYHIWDLWRIHHCLHLDHAKLLATALLSSCLHYCNSHLHGIVYSDLTKLQRIQNQLACVPLTRSVALLWFLHWLPVKFSILFKISLLTYKSLHEKRACYLHSMLAASLPSHTLRSNKGISLSVPRVETNTGSRAFHSCAPSLWSSLPLSVSSAISVLSSRHVFWLALSHIDSSTPDDPLMLSNCFIDFAIEHQFGCRATEPGFAGDTGAVEICLINCICCYWTSSV